MIAQFGKKGEKKIKVNRLTVVKNVSFLYFFFAKIAVMEYNINK